MIAERLRSEVQQWSQITPERRGAEHSPFVVKEDIELVVLDRIEKWIFADSDGFQQYNEAAAKV